MSYSSKMGDPIIIMIEVPAGYKTPFPLSPKVQPPKPGVTYCAMIYPIQSSISIEGVKNLLSGSYDENWLDLLMNDTAIRTLVRKRIAVINYETFTPLITVRSLIDDKHDSATGYMNLENTDSLNTDYYLVRFYDPG